MGEILGLPKRGDSVQLQHPQLEIEEVSFVVKPGDKVHSFRPQPTGKFITFGDLPQFGTVKSVETVKPSWLESAARRSLGFFGGMPKVRVTINYNLHDNYEGDDLSLNIHPIGHPFYFDGHQVKNPVNSAQVSFELINCTTAKVVIESTDAAQISALLVQTPVAKK